MTDNYQGKDLKIIPERVIIFLTISKEDDANGHSSYNKQGTGYHTD